MKVRLLLSVLAAAGIAQVQAQGLNHGPEHSPTPVQVTCSEGRAEHLLMRASVADEPNPRAIEIRSGAATRSVDLADIESIDVTGPVNRMNRLAWAMLKPRGGEAVSVGLFLRSPDGTLVLEGFTPQGKPDSIDVLECKRMVFKAGT